MPTFYLLKGIMNFDNSLFFSFNNQVNFYLGVEKLVLKLFLVSCWKYFLHSANNKYFELYFFSICFKKNVVIKRIENSISVGEIIVFPFVFVCVSVCK